MWPLAARGQQPAKLPTIGFLGPNTSSLDSARVGAFVQRLRELGRIEGRNVAIEYRWAEGRTERLSEFAAEFVRLEVDVIVTSATPPVVAAKQATSVIPIVFAAVTDPVGGGLVASLARPGGNSTGFINFEYGISTKWLQLLKEITPGLTRAGVMRDSLGVGGGAQFGAIQGVAPSLGVEVTPIDVRDAGGTERAVTAFARSPNGGLIVTSSRFAIGHRDLIITLAARYRLPTVYPYRLYGMSGGLVSYGPDQVDQFRRAAGYVDRILKGEKPADLPVQAPTKYELVINLKTAKALGLDVPPMLLARADEVIE